LTATELEGLVRSLWDFDNPAASYEVMRGRASQASEPERSIWVTQCARALGLQNRFAEALELLAGIDPGLSHHVKARWAIETGRVHNSRGDPAQARPLFDLALEEAEAASTEGLAIDAIHMLAIVASTDHEALELNHAGLARAEASRDPEARRWRGSLLNNLGWTHFDAGRYDLAVSRFEEALSVREEEGDAHMIEVARSALADARRAMGG
jgi:tetratricopeptide (TPR) repeat protein